MLKAISNIQEPTKRQELGKQLYDFVEQEIERYTKEIKSKSEGTDKLRDECGQLRRFSNREFFDEILAVSAPIVPPPPSSMAPEPPNVPPPPTSVAPEPPSVPPPSLGTKLDIKPNITEVTISQIQQARAMLARDTQEKIEERNEEPQNG